MNVHTINLFLERLDNIDRSLQAIAAAVESMVNPPISIKLEPGASQEEIERIAEVMASIAQRRNART